jgi:portal protein
MAAGVDDLQAKLGEGVKMPRVDGAMDKVAPTADASSRAAKGTDKDDETLTPKQSEKLLARMRKRFTRCIEAESKNRSDALDDLKFKAGQQWPADIAAQRNNDKRPCLTINKIPTFTRQITNDGRMNRPTINVSPVGGKGDQEAAQLYTSMIRAIERDCAADIAYDTAFESSVDIGFGYVRILTEYEGPSTFNQVIVVQRVRNPFTVYLDPDRQEPDGSDSKYGFISELIVREDFEEEYPKAQTIPWVAGGIGEDMKLWNTQTHVRIAEYFEIENKTRTLVHLANGHSGYEDELHDDVKTAISNGWVEVLKRRTVQVPQWYWIKATAVEVLSRKKWMGKWIPIVEWVGNEIDLEGKVIRKGVIRDAKDPQRMYNYAKTSETELWALMPKAPYIMEEGQVEGHQAQWKQANTKSYPYLLYKGTDVNGKPAPPPQRNQPMGPPAAILASVQGAAEDMQAVTGIRFDATKGERLFDESGRALRELKRVTDIGSFHYVDNDSRSKRQVGRIFVDLIPKIYDTPRAITILREDGKDETVGIHPMMGSAYAEQRDATGKTRKIFNPTVGQYGVTVTIGPSYASKRIEAADSMMQFVKALPQTAMLIADLIAKNQDWPGAEEMATRLAKALPVNLLTPEQKEVPPQIQALLGQMDQQIKQLSQERQQLMAALSNQNADRAIMVEKINKDFEAKVLKIASDKQEQFDKAVTQMERMVEKFEHSQQIQALQSQLQQQQPAPGGQSG